MHSWPGHHTHHLVVPDQFLPRAFEAPEKISTNFVQDPAIGGFQVFPGKRRLGTWIVWASTGTGEAGKRPSSRTT